ncbi:MAG: manganese efflux pump MntP family protein [Candidatus Bathyarchaeia archaeon]
MKQPAFRPTWNPLDLPQVLVAVSLAMDAFSVSIAHGLVNRSFKSINAMKLGISFGLFQTFMPILGWLAGINVVELISGFDHWVAFGLLAFIGARMIYESVRDRPVKLVNSLTVGALLLLSIATSIDALAVGLSLSFLRVPILAPAALAGITTFSLSFLGVYFGSRFGRLLGNKVELIGGAILLCIGLRILLEHL